MKTEILICPSCIFSAENGTWVGEGPGEAGRGGGTQGILMAETTLCEPVPWIIHVLVHLFKAREHTAPEENPSVNYGLQSIMLYKH